MESSLIYLKSFGMEKERIEKESESHEKICY